MFPISKKTSVKDTGCMMLSTWDVQCSRMSYGMYIVVTGEYMYHIAQQEGGAARPFLE